MKNLFHLFLSIGSLALVSCVSSEPELPQQEPVKIETVINYLPFKNIELNDLSAFRPTAKNWSVVGEIFADRTTPKSLIFSEGSGILYNANDQAKNKNLQTQFEHGDIEIEFDVMMPLRSNSGVYFQGRYEIQLLDSWGVAAPKHSDIGGVYQRWNKNAQKGSQGYEGTPPRVNAAKAPGLWQHFKIIFHAPKFDKKGRKIKNAWFEEVWLNGVLVQENVSLSGPTRGGNAKEVARAPLMIQGDHGPVAFKNIKYKLYEGRKITLSKLERTEYESTSNEWGDLDTIPALSRKKTKRFSLVNVTSKKEKKIVNYTGTLNVPMSGTYLFEGITKGKSELRINNKTVLNMYGNNKKPVRIIDLEKGSYPFQLIYNQSRPWQRGFKLHVEGPEMQRYSLQEGVAKGAGEFDVLKGIIIENVDKPRTQRSFINHNGVKRTHCISVGTPEGIHYSYDLARGSLLKVWSGAFLNTTHMWLSRGFEQLGEPVGFSVGMHGDLEFASLEDENQVWPYPLIEDRGIHQLGYTFDNVGMPTFSYQIGKSTIKNHFTVSNTKRSLKKSITVSARKTLWHKVAEGENIKLLPDNTYMVNNESYFVAFEPDQKLNPILRKSNNKDELLVKVPKGKNSIEYSIIW